MRMKYFNLIIFYGCLTIGILNFASELNSEGIEVDSQEHQNPVINEATRAGLHLYYTSGGGQSDTINGRNAQLASHGLTLHNSYLQLRRNQFNLEEEQKGELNKTINQIVNGTAVGFGQTMGSALAKKTWEAIAYCFKSSKQRKRESLYAEAVTMAQENELSTVFQQKTKAIINFLTALDALPFSDDQKDEIRIQAEKELRELSKKSAKILLGITLPDESQREEQLNTEDNLILSDPVTEDALEDPTEEITDEASPQTEYQELTSSTEALLDDDTQESPDQ